MPCRANGEPYVNDKHAIVIYPGEHFAIDVTIENGKVIAVAPRPAEGDLANTVELSFSGNGNSMNLTVQSHLASTIKYDATMKGPDDRLVYTSSCPVRAGLAAFEGWPHSIKFLELSNFTFQGEGDDGACR